MRVKRYLVDSMPDALEKIRIDLGKDAIILNTKPVKTGGFLGFFSKRQIEVIAAVDGKQANERMEKGRPEKVFAHANSYVAKQAYQRTTAKPSLETAPLQAGEQQPESPVAAVAILQKQVTIQENMNPKPTEQQAADVSKSEEKPVASDSPASAMQNGEIVQEIRDMREVFQKLLLKPDASRILPKAFCNIRDRLNDHELENDLVVMILQEMAKRVDDTETVDAKQVEAIASEVIQVLLSPVSTVPAKIGRKTKVAFFFGPTGVGKTTTIAKLAAEAMLKERRKVGFITTDTFRIGAVEQLKTYANILNVPLEVVFTAKDLPLAMERLGHCDLIFVDTAGRNYRNNEYVQGISGMLSKGDDSENYLVLSLTSRYSDMKPIVQNFHDVPINKVIFTKADETMVYGSILNLAHEFGLPLSYITVGQNVPDDIIEATPEIVSKLILGEKAYA